MSGRGKRLALGLDVPELPIALGRRDATSCLEIQTQRIAQFLQKSPDYNVADVVSPLFELPAQVAQAATNPDLLAHRITGHLVAQQPFENVFDIGILLLGRLGAAIAPRTIVEPA